jgi:rhodanese-related sulfurtransferase
VLMLATMVGMGYPLVAEEGFLSYSPAIAAVKDAHLAAFTPKLRAGEVEGMLGKSGVTFVDARLREDYDMGHLMGAINLPPNSNDAQCEELLQGVPRQDRIVVYCQSNGCPYSERIARKLIAIGYRRIDFFTDGWVGWEQFRHERGETSNRQ